MGKDGKFRRWKISFHRDKTPPPEFLCPISKTLMSDPTIVSSGQTFERLSIQICKDLNFTPTLPDSSTPDFTTLIPNLALKTSIQTWCSKTQTPFPLPPSHSHLHSLITSLISHDKNLHDSVLQENPNFCTYPRGSVTEPTVNSGTHLFNSSSSEESVIANTDTIPLSLPFTMRPSCFSSPSSSSEFVVVTTNSEDSELSNEEELCFVEKMNSLDVYEQEQAVMLLRKTTRNKEEARVCLCTERILFAIKPLLGSRYAALQTNAAAALVNLSLVNGNKVKIVRSGVVPYLVEILRNGFDEAREHAAGAVFSLSLEDGNKTAIGVLGALPVLLHELRCGTRRSRHDSALALYHLTLVQSNRVKMMKIGAVSSLLSLLRDGEVGGRVVLVVCNLAACEVGRGALMDGNAVECLVGVLRDGGDESIRENCVAALHSLSHGSLRFKGLARDSGVEGVLRDVVETGSERAKEKAKRILETLWGPMEDVVETGSERAKEKAKRILETLWGPMESGDEDEVDWEAVMKGGVTRARHRVIKSHGPNSTEF